MTSIDPQHAEHLAETTEVLTMMGGDVSMAEKITTEIESGDEDAAEADLSKALDTDEANG